jgi:glycosyltransferase involved in cell wall biosynthesis
VRATVVIRSKDEADRLRLTLVSLASQTEPAEVVVVNDGSTDHTAEVLVDAAREMDLRAVHHARPAGRSVAANVGAAQATGDVLLFLDGDTLAAPDLVARHLEAHRRMPRLVVRGETWHLRCTRPFLDPEAGTPQPGEEARVERMPVQERERALVTRRQIRGAFAEIERRGQRGVYPGVGPRRLVELEKEALDEHPDCPVLWAAASGSNQSVNRAAFLDAGGFDPELTINEHRELALRLCRSGLRMTGTPGRSYHMIHRSGWRDPLQETAWEEIFYRAHPLPEVPLLAFFWGSLSDPVPFPATAAIPTLPELARCAERYRGIIGLKEVREAHLRVSMAGSQPS